MKKKIKVAAVLSTAAFLSMCAPLISFASQGWTQENGGWAYYNANGERRRLYGQQSVGQYSQ